MGTADAACSAAARARARDIRSRATALRSEAETQRRRTETLCDQIAEKLPRATHRSFGDRGDRFRLRLGRLLPLVRFARTDLRRWLETAGLPPDVVGDVTLACSEACANAVEHAEQATRQLVEIEACRDETQLELRVRDYGSWSEHGQSDLRGRGIDIIGRLMHSVSIQSNREGTQIVMRRNLAANDSHPGVTGD